MGYTSNAFRLSKALEAARSYICCALGASICHIMSMKIYPSQEKLNELFTLAPEVEQGIRWKVKPRRGVHVGDPAGATWGKYAMVQINKKLYTTHRIVWIMVNGSIDRAVQIDHIDNNKKNNDITNLRRASNGTNQMNMRAKCNSRTGVRGLSIHNLHRSYNGYRYNIQVSGTDGVKHRKTYALDVGLELVLAVVTAMKRELHGEFYREEYLSVDEIRDKIKYNYGIDV